MEYRKNFDDSEEIVFTRPNTPTSSILADDAMTVYFKNASSSTEPTVWFRSPYLKALNQVKADTTEDTGRMALIRRGTRMFGNLSTQYIETINVEQYSLTPPERFYVRDVYSVMEGVFLCPVKRAYTQNTFGTEEFYGLRVIPKPFEPIYDAVQLAIDRVPEDERIGLTIPKLDLDFVRLEETGMTEEGFETLTVFYADIMERLLKTIVTRMPTSSEASISVLAKGTKAASRRERASRRVSMPPFHSTIREEYTPISIQPFDASTPRVNLPRASGIGNFSRPIPYNIPKDLPVTRRYSDMFSTPSHARERPAETAHTRPLPTTINSFDHARSRVPPAGPETTNASYAYYTYANPPNFDSGTEHTITPPPPPTNPPSGSNDGTSSRTDDGHGNYGGYRGGGDNGGGGFGNGNGGEPPEPPDSSHGNGYPRRGHRGPGGPGGPGEPGGPGGPGGYAAPGNDGNNGRGPRPFRMDPVHFDSKLKPDVVDHWDGDPDTLITWIESINMLSERSPIVFDQLGDIVPRRLQKRAKNWFYGLSTVTRRNITENWDTLRYAIRNHFMNRAWLDRQKKRAFEARYRDKSHPHEKPSDFVYRKIQLLELVVAFTDSEIIMEIMESAPPFWAQIIDTQRLVSLEDLIDAIKYHEERLEKGTVSDDRIDEIERRLRDLTSRNGNGSNNYRPFRRDRPSPSSPHQASTNLVGSHATIGKPPYPQDDNTVSKNGRTPESKGARPCRHCGSPKHWDNECRYSKKGGKLVRSNYANPTTNYLETQQDYEDLYYATTDEEEETSNASEEEEVNFPTAPAESS
jgi:hypothetical protein